MKKVISFSLSAKTLKLIEFLADLTGLTRSSVLDGVFEYVGDLIFMQEGGVLVPIYDDFIRSFGYPKEGVFGVDKNNSSISKR